MSILSPDSWKSISPHLDRALDLPEEERAAWIESLDHDDPTLAARLRDLLDEQRILAREGFLEKGPLAIPAQAAGEGATIGAYKLMRAIGEGGMGTVWLAERSDGELHHKVAIKLLRTGADRPALRERFVKERQFLANLNHPSITRLLDAGHTVDNRPYFIMEFVEGVPIDVYAARLDLRDQLALFLGVCEGVSHAHGRLIVHRDLKPSNILVDASGHPKLLDFGIAKLLDESADGTQTIDRALTPNYASPEQFLGIPQTIATDIYSLGAVLYKLLTGRSPHESETAVVIAGRKITPPSRLKSDLPDDFDYITAKALRTEPDERYVSVDAFADDVRAFLEWRPVKARSGDRWYRTQRFLRRHWIPVATSTVMTVGLAAGLYVANRERALAQGRFAQVRQLANKVLALDTHIRGLPGSTKARQEIIAMSKEYLEALGTEGNISSALALDIGVAYVRLGEAQGVPTVLNLGQHAEAEESLRKADRYLESVLATQPHNRTALLESAELAQGRMILADSDHRCVETLAHARRAAGQIDILVGLPDVSLEEKAVAARIHSNVALAHKNQRLYKDSIRHGRRAIEVSRSMPDAASRVCAGLSIIADAQRALGDLDGSLQTIAEARRTLETAEFSNAMAKTADTFSILWREGMIRGVPERVSLGQTDEAVTVFQQAFDLIEQAATQDPNDAGSRIRFASGGRELGGVLRDGNPVRALAVYDKALARLREVAKNNKARRGEAELLAGSSYALRRLKRFDEAKQRIDTAFRLLRETKDYPSERIRPGDEVINALRALADYHAETGQPQRAAEIYEELREKIMSSKADPLGDLHDATTLSPIYEALAGLRRRTGQADRAKEMADLRLKLWEHWDRKLPNNHFVVRQLERARLPQYR